MANDAILSMRLPEDLHAALREVAQARGTTASGLLRDLIDREIKAAAAPCEVVSSGTRTAVNATLVQFGWRHDPPDGAVLARVA